MSLESTNFIKGLVATNPEGTDPKSQGDDHLRLLKNVLKNQFSGFTEGIAITKTESQINAMLLAGAFGLGGPAINANESDLNNPDIPTGFYYVTAQALGVLPANEHSYMIYIDNPAANFALRVIIQGNNAYQWNQLKISGVWQTYKLVRDQFNTPSQTSLIDTLAGAILTPGSFGVGLPMPAGSGANLNAAPFIKVGYNGLWSGANWTNAPAGEATAPAVVELKSYSPDWAQQTFTSLLSHEEYVRNWYNATSFTPWERVLKAGLFVKAQNGYQVTDGIMRQWFKTGPIAANTQVAIAFPFPFSVCYSAVANCAAWGPSSYSILGVADFNPTTVFLNYMSNAAANSGNVWVQAVGLP